MSTEIAILHGWSDNADGSRPLRDFLVAAGFTVRDIWLGDYISRNDDVRIQDVSTRMEQVVQTMLSTGVLTKPFDLITHSTGALVARDWLARFHPDGAQAPVRRLLMLAPPNFGSYLAATGKSFIGRILKGWDNWFQSGREMLNGLELASPYQWDLALLDLLDDGVTGANLYGPGRIMPFVLIGGRGWKDGLAKIANEKGADGTVRAAGANFNAYGMTFDFRNNPNEPAVTQWKRRCGFANVPFGLLPDYDHGSIHQPHINDGRPDQVGQLILDALRCGEAQYDALAAAWKSITETTGKIADPQYHQYIQLVFYAHDDQGEPVTDYLVEFFDPDTDDKFVDDTVFFQRDIIEDAHVNSQSGAYRCLFIDRTDLINKYYAVVRAGTGSGQPRRLALSVSAAPPGRDVSYFPSIAGAKGKVIVHAENEDARATLPARFWHNSTHLIELVLPRTPGADVFRLIQ